MNREINSIHWIFRRGMREIYLLLREFSNTSMKDLNSNDISIFDEVLDYDDQKLYDYIFKNVSLGKKDHEIFINKYLKTFSKLGNF